MGDNRLISTYSVKIFQLRLNYDLGEWDPVASEEDPLGKVNDVGDDTRLEVMRLLSFFARTRQTVAMTHFRFVWFNNVTKHLLSNDDRIKYCVT